MSDDDGPRDVRDLRLIWRTVTVAAIVIATAISGIVYAVSWSTRMEARIEAVEKAQAQKDREAARELWRRERERWIPKPPEPKP
jgi:hypothetical protein